MKKYGFFSLLFGFICSSIMGQSPFSPEVDSLILRGIDQTFLCKFDSAKATFQKVIDLYPDHFVGYFYQAATFQSEMMDYETNQWEDDFYRLIEKAIRMGKKQIDECDNDPWTYFYLGSAYSYKGLYQGKTGSYISGFISARKGLRHLQKAMELDSTLYDAYMGLGTYKYWSGRFYKFLKWLPWIRDERDEGIRMVKLSVERGTFSYWVGLNSLAWIEYDRKNYVEALGLFQKGLEKYPGSRFFIWGVADCYFGLGHFAKAVVFYEDLLSSIQCSDFNNGYNEIECLVKIVLSRYALMEYEEAFHKCEIILEKKVKKEIAKRLNKHFQIAEDYKKRCVEALGRKSVILE